MNENISPIRLHETFTIIPVSQFLPLLEEIRNLILTKSESSKEDKWFNLTELCNYHPDKPSKQTVYGWVSKGCIPVHKEGKKLRFLKSEIDEWLRRGKIKTSEDFDSEVEEYFEAQKSRLEGRKKILQKKGGKL